MPNNRQDLLMTYMLLMNSYKLDKDAEQKEREMKFGNFHIHTAANFSGRKCAKTSRLKFV